MTLLWRRLLMHMLALVRYVTSPHRAITRLLETGVRHVHATASDVLFDLLLPQLSHLLQLLLLQHMLLLYVFKQGLLQNKLCENCLHL